MSGARRLRQIQDGIYNDADTFYLYQFASSLFDMFKQACLKCQSISSEEERYMQTALMIDEDSTFEDWLEFFLDLYPASSYTAYDSEVANMLDYAKEWLKNLLAQVQQDIRDIENREPCVHIEVPEMESNDDNQDGEDDEENEDPNDDMENSDPDDSGISDNDCLREEPETPPTSSDSEGFTDTDNLIEYLKVNFAKVNLDDFDPKARQNIGRINDYFAKQECLAF